MPSSLQVWYMDSSPQMPCCNFFNCASVFTCPSKIFWCLCKEANMPTVTSMGGLLRICGHFCPICLASDHYALCYFTRQKWLQKFIPPPTPAQQPSELEEISITTPARKEAGLCQPVCEKKVLWWIRLEKEREAPE